MFFHYILFLSFRRQPFLNENVQHIALVNCLGKKHLEEDVVNKAERNGRETAKWNLSSSEFPDNLLPMH